MHFEAAAQYRLSQEDFEKSRYGEEIARLRVAEGLTKKGIDAGKKGVAESVVSETKVSIGSCWKKLSSHARTFKRRSRRLWREP